jgi:hypothetical protein
MADPVHLAELMKGAATWNDAWRWDNPDNSCPSKPLRKQAVNSFLRNRKLSSERWLCCVALRLTFKGEVLYGSQTSIVQFCVDTCALCERRCRCAPFGSVSFLLSAAGRRNSIAFR